MYDDRHVETVEVGAARPAAVAPSPECRKLNTKYPVRTTACRGFKDVFTLSRPMAFGGLGNGRFHAAQMANLEVRLLGLWCRHAAYVVPDAILETRYDLLVGHDFMQKFDVNIASRKREVILDRGALKMAQTVRRGRV